MRSFAAAIFFLLPVTASVAAAQEARVFTYSYEVEVTPSAAEDGPVDVFIPIPRATSHQEVLSRSVKGTITGKLETESRYGNLVWHGHLDRFDGLPAKVSVVTKVRRTAFKNERLEGNDSKALSDLEREEFALYLGPNRRVPVAGSLVTRISREIAPGETRMAAVARAIYDYVIDNMEYKKVGSGWGNGDTHWACSERYGNCTDFHALFISLARSKGIPAKFAIGSSIPLDQSEGELDGYHCWVEFFLPGAGWVPIDASEAKKHPEKREMLFGTHPADRIELSVGRDLDLGSAHTGAPLSYFVYPYVEVGGKPYKQVVRRVSFTTEP